MDKKALHKIFESAFNDAQWLEVLQSVFGAKNGLLAQPKDITAHLKGNYTAKAKAAYELGSFTTSDDRIIGLYKIEVNPDVWLERNKVGLRELLRDVYKYDVDGAIIVFVQDQKWRLSFVSEIKMLNDEGEVIEQATEPKRYTYLLGEGEKVRTPSERLAVLSNKTLSIQDILNAFSVEALNEEFYKIIQAYFYELVGGKVGKGRKQTDYGKGILHLPGVPKTNRQVYQEFAVRLIGRSVFCWFLKMKKSEAGDPLLPESLLASKAVKSHPNYYHSILERVFFQTLNTPMDKRVDNLPKGAEQIPFLNGGLFEPGTDDYYKPNRLTGLSEHLNTLKIPDSWFQAFFEELEKYNFTIDENSVTDVEVSVDPEMLGRIFENLLAEIDPDSGETARKATGSFYTPREIVDYMATESLVQYLYNKTGVEHDMLRPIFKMLEAKAPDFTPAEKNSILDALDRVKILDPACGSGAFPMGVLQKIVQALQKLDPDAEWWKQRQVDRISNALVKKQLREKLESSGVDYARKIGIIQNSLYGVDIQPVAAEISKLRCFLTLIVDEHIDESKTNRGIEPLPNLEFKFVTADTLINLPEEKDFGGLFNANYDLDQLDRIRQDYLQSYGEKKERLKLQFKATQDKIAKQQLKSGAADINSRAWLISTWKPFAHDKSDWFDPKWMFGVDSFDIVIGNPPYGGVISNSLKKSDYYSETSFGGKESYKFFFNRSVKILLPKPESYGTLCFITSDSYLEKDNFEDLRSFILGNAIDLRIVALGDDVFKNVNLPTSISTITVSNSSTFPAVYYVDTSSVIENKDKINLASRGYRRISPFTDLKKRFTAQQNLNFSSKTKSLIDIYDQVMGVKVYQRGKGKPKQTSHELENDVFISKEKKDENWLPFIDSGVKRYHFDGVKKFIKYGEWLAEPRKPKYFTEPKIILREVVNPSPFACYIKDICVVKNTNAVIIRRTNEFSLFYLLPILNSNFFSYYLSKESPKSRNKSFPSITSKLLKNFPIPTSNTNSRATLELVAQYLNKLYQNTSEERVNKYVSNSHVAKAIEDLVNAMVIELYFKEDFEKAGIAFIKYAERDFESIVGKPEAEQIEIIHRAYQKLREKDNEIRNNLKLMDIKLADIVLPIKAAK